MKVQVVLCVFVLLLTLTYSQTLHFVSNALGSNMVLQRAPQKANVWGWSKQPGSVVTVDFNNKKYTATAAADGAWNVLLDATPAGGPYNIAITSNAGESASLLNVLFGDVWVCSGQSNMQMTVASVFNAAEEIARAANYPNIRVFTVGQGTWSHTPLKEFATIVQGWNIASPQSIGMGNWSAFSAACWFFGRDLYDNLQVPIGLFSDNWGGTRSQAWSSPDANAKCPGLTEAPIVLDKSAASYATKKYTPRFTVQKGDPNDASALWYAMMIPILPMSIKGATWYQGEANAGQPNYYACGFPQMIADWRAKWGGDTDKQFSFFFVQLAPWMANGVSSEAEIRLAQMYATKLPNVGVATAFDWGDPTGPFGDIHPRYKQVVGQRLALAARGITYGQNVQYKGPEATGYTVLSNGPSASVRVAFAADSLGKGLVKQPKSCNTGIPVNQCAEFEIGTADGRWTAATYTIDGATVVVSANTANAQVNGVRYGWANYAIASLYNVDGLPALPFAYPNPIVPVGSEM